MTSQNQIVYILKDSIEEAIDDYLNARDDINNSRYIKPNHMEPIKCEFIKDNIKNKWKEAKMSIPETYIFLGQYPSTFLYGLYKADNSVIYIVKSFLDTVLCVVPFHKKYFED